MLRGAAGIVLMVDASAPDRITETAAELHFMLQDQTLQEIPLLVLANKQDVPNAQSVEQVAVSLALMMQVNRPWKIQGCSLLNGAQEVDGGMYWLLQCIVNRQALKAV
jgi:signal recognition particle receptor subunit beta